MNKNHILNHLLIIIFLIIVLFSSVKAETNVIQNLEITSENKSMDLVKHLPTFGDGPRWIITWDDKRNSLKNLKTESIVFDPNRVKKQSDLEYLTSDIINRLQDYIRLANTSIKLSDYEHAPINDKYYLTYHQYYEDIMVYDSEIYFVISGRGSLVNSIFRVYSDIDAPTSPKISNLAAINIAQKHLIDQNTSMFMQFKEKLGFEESIKMARPESATLIILPMEKGEEFTYNLAWQTEFNVPLPKRVFVNAVNGEILKEEETYAGSEYEINGFIQGAVYKEKYTDAVDATHNLGYEELNATLGQENRYGITDLNGRFKIYVDNQTNYTIRTNLDGPYVRMLDINGSMPDYANSFYSGSSSDFYLNWNYYITYDYTNIFFHVNEIHNRFRNYPFEIDVGKINAYTNYFVNPPDSGFGAPNNLYFPANPFFAYSTDSIYHEFTHAVTYKIYDDKTGTSGTQWGAIFEGVADYFASSFNNDPIYGDFGEKDPRTRIISNFYSNDLFTNGGKNQDNGRIISSTLWDLRKEDKGIGSERADEFIFSALKDYQPETFKDFYDAIVLASGGSSSKYFNKICSIFKEHKIIDSCVSNLSAQIMLTNIGDGVMQDYYPYATQGNNWISLPGATKFYTVNSGESKNITVSINTSNINEARIYGGNIRIPTKGDIDGDFIDVPVFFSNHGNALVMDLIRYLIKRFDLSRVLLSIFSGSVSETNNLKVTLDWPTNDNLDFKVIDWQGNVYDKDTSAAGFSYSGGHPAEMSFGQNLLHNGTWNVTVNGSGMQSEELYYTLRFESFPDNAPPDNISFSDARLNYISACNLADEGLRVVFRATEANDTSGTININNATNQSIKAFLTGLVIPKDKQFVALSKSGVIAGENFSKTGVAQILLDADLKIKSADKDEWTQVLENSFNYWDGLIQNTSYYDKIISKTNWYYPDFTANKNVFITNITLNGSICDVYVENFVLVGDSQVDEVWVNYEQYGLNDSELADVNSKLEIWKGYINNLTDNISDPVLTQKLNSDGNFSDLRRAYASLLLAEWYKSNLNRDEVLFGDAINSENLSVFNLTEEFNKTYWDEKSYANIYNSSLSLPSGNFSFSWFGGISLINLSADVNYFIDYGTQNLLDDTRFKKYQKKGTTVYYPQFLTENKPDIKPLSVYFSTVNPEVGEGINITAVIKNQGSVAAGSFKVFFFDSITYPDGTVVQKQITNKTVSSLDAGEKTTISTTWSSADIGEHEIIVVVDYYNDVSESNELNNQKSQILDVVPSEPTITITSPVTGYHSYGYQVVNFTAEASDPQDGTLENSSISWNSSIDGILGTGTSINKTLSIGEPVITATAVDSDGHKSSNSIIVKITPSAVPVAKIKEPINNSIYKLGQTIHFRGEGKDLEDGYVSNYLWNSSIDNIFADSQNVTVTNELSVGNHTITLIVTDSSNQSNSTSINLAIVLSYPNVTITTPQNGQEFYHNSVINFSGAANDIHDGNISGKLNWVSNINGTIGTGSSFSRQLSRGFHNIMVFAVNSFGLASYSVINLTVQPPLSPVVSIVRPYNDVTIVNGNNITFDAVATDPEDGPLPNASIVWSSNLDGTIGTGTHLVKTNMSIGIHQITLTATDSENNATQAKINITIQSSPPVVNISLPVSGNIYQENAPIIFNGTAADLEDGIVTNLIWYSDIDGTLGTGSFLNRSNLTKSPHKITLNATDSNGVISTKSVNIVIVGFGTMSTNMLSDGSTEKNLTYSVPGSQVIYIKLPKAANVTTAELNMTGYQK